MSRPQALAILQKTYDDSYLKCSTAVYYESQGDEAEAMRCWKTALDQIYEQHASKLLPNQIVRSETEEALVDSLRQLELQCKERIDLLEALRISRQDAMTPDRPVASMPSSSTSADPRLPTTPEKGWIGQGTIPAIRYPELSRPVLPKRPPSSARTSSELAVVARSQSPRSSSPTPALSGSPKLAARNSQSMRSPSPEKYTMRTTLRSGKTSDRSSRASHKFKSEGPGASKAATLAWSSLGLGERLSRAQSTDVDTSVLPPTPSTPDEPHRRTSASSFTKWDAHTRRLIASRNATSPLKDATGSFRNSDDLSQTRPSTLSLRAGSNAVNTVSIQDTSPVDSSAEHARSVRPKGQAPSAMPSMVSISRRNYQSDAEDIRVRRKSSPDVTKIRRRDHKDVPSGAIDTTATQPGEDRVRERRDTKEDNRNSSSSQSEGAQVITKTPQQQRKGKRKENTAVFKYAAPSSEHSAPDADDETIIHSAWRSRKKTILHNLPPGVEEAAAKQILNDIVVHGDEVHWGDVAGLEIAKNALRETVVYPFLRPDLFMGLREPARGMLLFGPPGTGKTMLARAVATESNSTFFSISASSLTSKYLGESEKLVRALFLLAKALAPSIIFVDEIDSLLSQRSGAGEHEATRRIKTEFLIQWSDLQRAAAGRAVDDKERTRGDPNRVLVLAATNLPWAIDEAARRRFVRRQYIPLPEPETRSTQLHTLLGQQKHSLTDSDVIKLVTLTDGFSGSDITALAKDAAMGPLRSLGEALLQTTMDEIRAISLEDFESSLKTIRPSVSKVGLKEYEDWAKEFGERGG